MDDLLEEVRSITPAQTRRLHAAWRDWTRRLRLRPEADGSLRHYYVQLFSGGSGEAWELTAAQASRVITWFERLSGRASTEEDYAAGTAGRRGFPERRWVRPNPAAWRALWATAETLGMDRERLERFMARQFAGLGLHGFRDIRTMADLNRVLWALKAMLRRRQAPKPASGPHKRAA